MPRMKIEYGSGSIDADCPLSFDSLGMRTTDILPDPAQAIRTSYARPIDSPPLSELARAKLETNPQSTAVVVVSDNTRPVPYRGAGGILIPLLEILLSAGYVQERITILIGNGSHRAMTETEIEAMLGLRQAGYQLAALNHDYEMDEDLVYVGKTLRGSPVRINRLYAQAHLRIVTGLVESHFMAGASGGRKGICPAIASKETLKVFHGPEILESAETSDLVLEGNPCNEEAEQAAELAGCDFAVNVTLDSSMRITGVFSGNLFSSHREAVRRIREYVSVPLDGLYDLVVIPGGFVAVNHYQAAKAAVEATRAVKPGGMIVLVVRHNDRDPIGSREYRKTMALLKRDGSERFLRTIKSKDWTFTHDQWQTQMWAKVLDQIGGEENLCYCGLEIPEKEYAILPGIPGLRYLTNEQRTSGKPAEELMNLMVSRAVAAAVETLRSRLGRDPKVLLLRDGPYGVPVTGRFG